MTSLEFDASHAEEKYGKSKSLGYTHSTSPTTRELVLEKQLEQMKTMFELAQKQIADLQKAVADLSISGRAQSLPLQGQPLAIELGGQVDPGLKQLHFLHSKEASHRRVLAVKAKTVADLHLAKTQVHEQAVDKKEKEKIQLCERIVKNTKSLTQLNENLKKIVDSLSKKQKCWAPGMPGMLVVEKQIANIRAARDVVESEIQSIEKDSKTCNENIEKLDNEISKHRMEATLNQKLAGPHLQESENFEKEARISDENCQHLSALISKNEADSPLKKHEDNLMLHLKERERLLTEHKAFKANEKRSIDALQREIFKKTKLKQLLLTEANNCSKKIKKHFDPNYNYYQSRLTSLQLPYTKKVMKTAAGAIDTEGTILYDKMVQQELKKEVAKCNLELEKTEKVKIENAKLTQMMQLKTEQAKRLEEEIIQHENECRQFKEKASIFEDRISVLNKAIEVHQVAIKRLLALR